MSLYTDLVEAGVPVSNWQSDLYFPVNDTSRTILARHPLQKTNASVFTSRVEKVPFYDVPFAYEPFWERRKPRP